MKHNAIDQLASMDPVEHSTASTLSESPEDKEEWLVGGGSMIGPIVQLKQITKEQNSCACGDSDTGLSTLPWPVQRRERHCTTTEDCTPLPVHVHQ